MAHLYWRLLIQGNAGGAAVSIEELQMFDASGTSLCTGGTASASSTFSPTYAASMAFDANFTTFWNNNSIVPTVGSPEWLQYQFASAVDVASFRIVCRENTPTQAPKNFILQYSDTGSAWTSATSAFNPTWVTPTQVSCSCPVATPGPNSYLMWRLYIRISQAGGSPSCAELALRTVAGGSTQTTSTPQYAQASTYYSSYATYGPASAFDGNTSSIWAGVGTPSDWIGYTFPTAQALIELTYTARNDGYFAQAPDSALIQGSNDGGATWTTVAKWLPDTWTIGLAQTFNWGSTPSPGTAPVWGPWSMNTGVVGVAYDEQWYLEGCATPTTYTLLSGSLPAGLAIANLFSGTTAGGHISGTPTAAGVSSFTIRASNAYGTSDQAFSITIAAASGGGGSAYVFLA